MKIGMSWILCCSILFFIGCVNPIEKDKKEYGIASIKLLIAKGDSILANTDGDKIKVFVKKNKGYIRVNNFSNWPKNIEVTINIIETVEPKLYVEIPYSESGDWANTYIHYFDKDGHLLAFVRKSSFFNGVCVDGILREKTTLIYGYDFNVISRDYELHSDEGRCIRDTAQCVFNYRFDFEVYKFFDETPLMKLN